MNCRLERAQVPLPAVHGGLVAVRPQPSGGIGGRMRREVADATLLHNSCRPSPTSRRTMRLESAWGEFATTDAPDQSKADEHWRK